MVPLINVYGCNSPHRGTGKKCRHICTISLCASHALKVSPISTLRSCSSWVRWRLLSKGSTGVCCVVQKAALVCESYTVYTVSRLLLSVSSCFINNHYNAEYIIVNHSFIHSFLDVSGINGVVGIYHTLFDWKSLVYLDGQDLWSHCHKKYTTLIWFDPSNGLKPGIVK